ncbi:MAG: glycosyltransferase [Lentilitoribacter sp.]
MHIMHIVTRLLRAGSEENTVETCRYQAEIGHQVTLVHGCEFDPYWYNHAIAGVELFELSEMVHPADPIADIRAFKSLRRLFKMTNPDVIHTHQSKAGILGRLAAHVLPSVFVVHGIHIVPFEGVGRVKRLLYMHLERWVASKTDLFIGVSHAVGQAFVDARVTTSNKVRCVRSGIKLDQFRAAKSCLDQNTLFGGHSPRPNVVLMMAAFEPRKRHIQFLEAFAQVRNECPKIKLLLAGQGPEEAAIRRAVVRLGLQNHVVFCGHRSDPESLFAMADMTVLTSEREGLPRVVVQSLASGVPTILNDLPGIGEIIQDGRNGVILPVDDIDGVAAQLVALMKDNAALRQLRNGAAETDVSEWDMTHFGMRTTELYRPCYLANKSGQLVAR